MNTAELIRNLKMLKAVEDGRPIALRLLEEIKHGQLETAQTWSPFGFLVIDVAPWNKKNFLRLHIWPPTPPITVGPNWPVHPHSSHLRSWVLTGSITNKKYEVVKTKDSSNYVLYYASCPMGESLLEQTVTPVEFSVSGACTYKPGEVYDVPRGEYHSTHAKVGSLTATLCLMWDRASETTLIVGKAGNQPEYRFRRPSPTDNEIQSLVTALFDSLEQTAPPSGRSANLRLD